MDEPVQSAPDTLTGFENTTADFDVRGTQLVAGRTHGITLQPDADALPVRASNLSTRTSTRTFPLPESITDRALTSVTDTLSDADIGGLESMGRRDRRLESNGTAHRLIGKAGANILVGFGSTHTMTGGRDIVVIARPGRPGHHRHRGRPYRGGRPVSWGSAGAASTCAT